MADVTDGLANAISDFSINNQSTASTSSDIQTRSFDEFKTDVVNGISGEWEEIIKKVTQNYNAEWFVTLLNDILYKGTKPEKNCWLPVNRFDRKNQGRGMWPPANQIFNWTTSLLPNDGDELIIILGMEPLGANLANQCESNGLAYSVVRLKEISGRLKMPSANGAVIKFNTLLFSKILFNVLMFLGLMIYF